MKKRIVVSPDNLPLRWPIHATWLVALSQSVWNVPEWGLGILWALVVIVWIVVIIDTFNRDNRKVFKDADEDKQ